MSTHELSKGIAFENAEDMPTNTTREPSLGELAERMHSRRSVLKGAVLSAAAVAATSPVALMVGQGEAHAGGHAKSRYNFKEILHGVDETHHVAEGYAADILIRWGDPVLPGAPEFDPFNQSAASQEKQFGYNNDFVGFVPLPMGAADSERGLLCVNHEYTSEEVMFPGLGRQDRDGFPKMTRELVETEMAAHGGSVVEIRRGSDGKWTPLANSKYNRRISARSTEMEITGPAAGHRRMQTNADKSGKRVIGTINNCAGGITPWGTYLMAEENFNGYFWGKDAVEGHPEEANLKRYGAPGEWYAWGKFIDRYDISKEPHEPNRFGWVVEVDPMDPASTPKKRTSLGRFKHEGAETIVNKDGRVVVYMGDDQRFDYLYKWVSNGKVDTNNRDANMDLLDDGTLYVAKFDDAGSMTWLALTFGEGPLTPSNGFESQADVLIETRRAADLLEATPMDRPEDVQPVEQTGKVYVMLTNNSKRKEGDENGPNPRAKNSFGQVLEITPTNGDHTAIGGDWDLLVVAGDPSKPEVKASWNEATSANGWFGSPDNAASDAQGRLWISTDQGSKWVKTGTADGVWGLETDGDMRGTGKMFFRAPIGAEVCGPRFTPDDKTLFVAIQHPATDGADKFPGFERKSTFEDPATRWPDFDSNTPPRPSVVAITKKDGGIIGS